MLLVPLVSLVSLVSVSLVPLVSLVPPVFLVPLVAPGVVGASVAFAAPGILGVLCGVGVFGAIGNLTPGCCTNRNERFHCHINSLICRSRVGVLLGYALLSVVMYSHNSAMKIKGKTLVRPIIACPER